MTTLPEGGFGGELGLLSLFDIGQLLVLNQATGRLTITSGERKGFLYFDGGRIVNAVDDTRAEGESAACRLFTWRTGTFAFGPEPASGTASITGSPDALMLEAARRMDEAALATGASAPVRELDRLREHQDGLEGLREVFQRVASEARAVPAGAAAPAFSPTQLYQLARPDDRLLFRTGDPPRLRRGGVWQHLPDPPLAASEMEQLRRGLVAASLPLATGSADGSGARRLELANGVTIRLAFVDELGVSSLWLQPMACAPAGLACLGAQGSALDALLDLADGLVLIGGRSTAGARRLLHVLLAGRDARHGESALVIGDDPTYAHERPQGVIATVPRPSSAAAVVTLAPELVALDPDSDPAALAHAASARLWWATGVGPSAATMACRWVSRARAEGSGALGEWLAQLPVTLAYSDAPDADDGDLGCRIVALSETERMQLFAGDAPALAAALASHGQRPVLRAVRAGS